MAQLRFRTNLTAWHSACFDKRDMSGSQRHIVASPADPPRKTSDNGSAVWDMRENSYYLELPYPITDYLTEALFTTFVSFKCHSITTNSATPHNNEALLGESLNLAGGAGIYLRNNGGIYSVFGRVGTTEASRQIELEKWYVCIFAYDGANGRVDFAIEPFDFFANPFGPGSANFSTAVPLIGRNHSGNMVDAEIGEVILCPEYRDDISIALVWNFMAARVTRRGDPEEQMRDLMTRRAIVSDRLGYILRTGRERLSVPLTTEAALTHARVLRADAGPTQQGPETDRIASDPWTRFESTILRREMDPDDQTVELDLMERSRIVAVASGRADRVGSDMDGTLLMGARVAGLTPVAPIVNDRTVNKCVLLRSGEPKMDDRGWYCETGGRPANSVFVDPLAEPWNVEAGTVVFEAIPADVPKLFHEDILVNETKVPASALLQENGELSLTQDLSDVQHGLPYLRFFYIGNGQVEVSDGSGQFWDWAGNGGAGEWSGTGPIPLDLPQADTWTEFFYGPIPDQGTEEAFIVWRGGDETLRLGYASFYGTALAASENSLEGAVGQFTVEPLDDIIRTYLPLVSPYAEEGCIRFRYEPLWHQLRMPNQVPGAETDVDTRICILRVGPFDPGDGDVDDVSPELKLDFCIPDAVLELRLDGSLIATVECSGANVWVPGTKYLITIAWSCRPGEPPTLGFDDEQTIILSVDGRQSAPASFPDPFEGEAPMLLSAQIHGEDRVHPNGIYSDFIVTSRPLDAFKPRLLEFEP